MAGSITNCCKSTLSKITFLRSNLLDVGPNGRLRQRQRTHAVDYSGDPDTWKTIVFTTLCIAQMGHALAVRSVNKLVIEINPFSNPLLLLAILGTILLQLAVVYIAPLRSFFGTHPLNLFELGVCFGCSLLIFVWIEGEKLFVRWFRARKIRGNS